MSIPLSVILILIASILTVTFVFLKSDSGYYKIKKPISKIIIREIVFVNGKRKQIIKTVPVTAEVEQYADMERFAEINQ